MDFMQSLIENRSVKLGYKADDWKDAVKAGTDMLVDSGAVEPCYYDAILSGIEKMGPYICIAPDFAMPHARPEDGVNRTAFALVTLERPVMIEGERVKMLITLAGSSSDEHMDGLMQVTQALDDEESETGINVEKFLDCTDEHQVLKVIAKALADH